MTMFDTFLTTFKEGLSGMNKGVPLNFPRLEKFLNGMHRGRYYTLFAEPGVGKSAFAWSVFVIGPLDHMLEHNKKIDARSDLSDEQRAAKKIDVKVILYSLEVVKSEVIAKMVCLKIYKDFGLIVSPEYVLNRMQDYYIHPVISYIVQRYKGYFDTLEKEGHLTIIDSPRTPSMIRKELKQLAEKEGKLSTNRKGEVIYAANNRKKYVIPIFDTVGNITIEPVNGKSSEKSTIDAHSANCRHFYRDVLNWIPINVSHANRSMSDPARAKSGNIFPKASDIKETNMLEQDSSVVLTLFNPMGHILTVPKLATFMKYDIRRLGERFRCIGILKNRHGGVNKRVGLKFVGENGHFEELPAAKDTKIEDYQDIINMRGAHTMSAKMVRDIVVQRQPILQVGLDAYIDKKEAEKQARILKMKKRA